MCGICGIWSSTDKPDEIHRDLTRMLACMKSRGTEDGAFLFNHLVIGSRRLPIFDKVLSRQPIYSEDRSIVLVGQGELFNHKELRTDLEKNGHVFSTKGDLECAVHLYEKLGVNFASHLRGQFALAVWDARNKQLILARDPAGICPLFYVSQNGRFAFGSTLISLTSLPWINKDIDPDALSLYLSLCYIPAPHTIYKNIRSLPPGHLLVFQNSAPVLSSYSAAETGSHHLSNDGCPENEDSLIAHLTEAVRRRLECDVEWGVLLSGGIDSAGLLAVAHQLTGKRIPCFHMRYGEPTFNESAEARKIATHCQAQLTQIRFLPEELKNNLSDFLCAMDQPLADESCYPLYLLDRTASKSVKMLLSGEGADEVFGGYETYQAALAAEGYRRWPQWIKNAFTEAASLLSSSDARIGWQYRLRTFFNGASLSTPEAHLFWRSAFSEIEIDTLLSPDFFAVEQRSSAADLFQAAYEKYPQNQEIARLMHLDRDLFLVNDLLAKADRMGMASTVETRFPYLDEDVISFADGRHPSEHIRGLLPWQNKCLLRRSLTHLLPDGYHRTAKRGFNMPIAACLRGPWAWLFEEFLNERSLKELSFVRKEAVQDLVDRFQKHQPVRIRALWAILILTMWLQLKVD